MKSISIFAVTVATLIITGCSVMAQKDEPVVLPEPAVMSAAVEYRVLHKADYNLDDSHTFKSFIVIDTDMGYRSLLARYSVEVPKPVDFDSQRVILVTMGTQPTGGYAVGLQAVTEEADAATANIVLQSPGEACVHTEALSNPYEFALIDTTLPIQFAESSVIEQCSDADS